MTITTNERRREFMSDATPAVDEHIAELEAELAARQPQKDGDAE